MSKLVLNKSAVFHIFVPQSSSDLACFVQFDKVNVYATNNYKQRYRAPTNFCFILKVNSTNGLIRERNYSTHLRNVTMVRVLFYGLLNRSYSTHNAFILASLPTTKSLKICEKLARGLTRAESIIKAG